MKEPLDESPYQVVINNEEQFSIWSAESEPPAGWRPTGFRGDRASCLAHIDEVWTDMRPRSLREWMAGRN